MAHTLPYTVQCPKCSNLFDITLLPVPHEKVESERIRTYRDNYVHCDDEVNCPACDADLRIEPQIAPDENHVARYEAVEPTPRELPASLREWIDAQAA